MQLVDAMSQRSPKIYDRQMIMEQIMEADGNNDGKLSWEEFKVMCLGEPDGPKPSESPELKR